MKSQGSGTIVKIVDGVMVMSLMEARKPLVWRIDVEKINAASLEVDGDDERGYTLKLVEAKGGAQDIAIFDKMEDAKAVLTTATHELLHLSGASVGGSCCGPKNKMVSPSSGGGCGKLHAFFAAFTALIVLVVLVIAFSTPPKNVGGVSGSVASPVAGSSGGQGEAVSADDFLNNR